MPTFMDNLISVGLISQKFEVTCTKENVYVSNPGLPPTRAKTLGHRNPQYIYITAVGGGRNLAASVTH